VSPFCVLCRGKTGQCAEERGQAKLGQGRRACTGTADKCIERETQLRGGELSVC
jgi:hypothetical protein